jgi:Ribbon-helix-helix protein, copG family
MAYQTHMEDGYSMKASAALRLDPNTRRKLVRVARRIGISKSEVIRRALNSWVKLIDSSDSPYEMIADLIGVVKGGHPKRSESSGKQFRKILAKKRKRA